MLLAEAQGVIGARFALGRRFAHRSLDLIQSFEEPERLAWRATVFFPCLERIGKFPSRMGHAAKMGSRAQCASGIIAVAHQ